MNAAVHLIFVAAFLSAIMLVTGDVAHAAHNGEPNSPLREQWCEGNLKKCDHDVALKCKAADVACMGRERLKCSSQYGQECVTRIYHRPTFKQPAPTDQKASPTK
jgi:hypothetical protein